MPRLFARVALFPVLRLPRCALGIRAHQSLRLAVIFTDGASVSVLYQ
jgi:hypothetical protein